MKSHLAKRHWTANCKLKEKSLKAGEHSMAQVCVAVASCTDEMLVMNAQQGDGEAFSELTRRSIGGSIKLARYILADVEEAEDQVQNSYLRAWLHLSQFQRQSKFSTWVFRIVTNQCLMRRRQLQGKTFIYLDEYKDDERTRQLEIADSHLTPEENFAIRQLTERLRKEITELPPLLRNVLMLRDLQEASTADVAEDLGISTSAVKSRLLRARVELRDHWKKREIKTQRVATAVGLSARSD